MIMRPRRLRRTAVLRDMVRETSLSLQDLIQPYFVMEGADRAEEVSSMPGVFRYTVDRLVLEAQKAWELGLRAFILFGIPSQKDASGSGAWNPAGVVPEALRSLRLALPEALLIADVCLCEYTSHGHCGLVEHDHILNDESLPLLAKAAVCYAAAGADVVAPSDMMDGRVASLRSSLDAANFSDVLLMSYSVKYASAYYGPFREAAGSAPQFGDRRSYQMDPGNVQEALREAKLDEAEGADFLMVKPALAYMDVLYQVCQSTHLPVVAYNVSGEYAMVKAAARNGWIDERRVVLETLQGFRRAGAKLIITYHATDVAQWWKSST